MKSGITGLPYSGKTTLFCALTGQEFDKLSHGKDVHVGTVKVPDERLDKLFEMFNPKKETFATMEYFDMAGQTVEKDKGMEPQMLQILKNADALTVVLDGFSENAAPRNDFEQVMGDFALNDLILVTNRLERIEKELRSKKTQLLLDERTVLETCRERLESGGSLLETELHGDEAKMLRGFQFLTLKPLVIVINISEDGLTSGADRDFEQQFEDVHNASCTTVCAELEMEIALLEENDRADFMESMNITEPARGKLIRLSYENLGLISFFTAGGQDEVRAWTVRKGSTARECAGAIHSDLERGFIRAETVAYDDLMSVGSFKAAREKGLLRVEGKEYIVKDGDILTIRFNV